MTHAPKSEVWKLYDVVDDRGETRDLAANKPAVVADLTRRFRIWQGSVTE